MLRLEGVASAYGRVRALKGIDLEARAGELTAIVGANGAGKTTLLRAISGIQPVTAGRILFEGRDVTRLAAHARVSLGIAQVPEGRQVWGPLAIEDNLRLGAWARRDRDVAADLDRVYAMFPPLRERRRGPAGALSGGQQQMLAIGRALMARPRILLLDEPSMGLSPLLTDRILDTVAALRRDGTTILMVEQNAARALALADRGYVLETGKVALEGTGAALRADERVKAAYLGI
jgi:branched-chain amino acid transport system ATP-binding protein